MKKIPLDITDINNMDDLLNTKKIELDLSMVEMALAYLEEVDFAFEVEGPGWRPLSTITKTIKRLRRAPYIENILMEFGNMRSFIEMVKEDDEFVAYSVGLFADGKASEAPERVDWGVKHEFGGFEFQVIDPNKEILTRGLSKKALRGETDLEKVVKQRIIKGSHKLIKIPKRSFLGDPFDRNLEFLIAILITKINDWLDRFEV